MSPGRQLFLEGDREANTRVIPTEAMALARRSSISWIAWPMACGLTAGTIREPTALALALFAPSTAPSETGNLA